MSEQTGGFSSVYTYNNNNGNALLSELAHNEYSGNQTNNGVNTFNNNINLQGLSNIYSSSKSKQQFLPCMHLLRSKDFKGLRDKKMVYCLNGIGVNKNEPSLWRSVDAHKKRLAAHRSNTCHPGFAGLNPNQISVGKIARILSMAGSVAMGGHRGLICFHSTGSGKTLAALTIMLQYWREPGRPIVLVTSLSNKRTNSHTVYAQNLIRFYGLDHPLVVRMVIMTPATDENRKIGNEFVQEVVNFQATNKRNDPKQRLHMIDHLLRRYMVPVEIGMGKRFVPGDIRGKFTILSFKEGIDRIGACTGKELICAKLGTARLLSPAGSVFIIDEAQGLFDDNVDKGSGRKFLEILQKLTPEIKNKVHVYIMTATPASSIQEWFELLHTVGPSMTTPLDWTTLKTNIIDSLNQLLFNTTNTTNNRNNHQRVLQKSMEGLRGLVSFADFRTDINQHACIVHHTHNIQMPFWYFAALCAKKYKPGEGTSLSGMYAKMMSGGSKSNLPGLLKVMTFAIKLPTGFPKPLVDLIMKHHEQAKMKKEPPFIVLLNNQRFLVHQKVRAMAYQANRMPGKQFVYVSTGIDGTQGDDRAKVMVEMFKGMGYEDISISVQSGMPIKTSKPRFFVLNSKSTEETRRNLKHIFDDPTNMDGSRLKIILATGKNYEGVDYKHLRGIHTADILPIPVERQLNGRGVRMCAHTELPQRQRSVLIKKYRTYFQNINSVKLLIQGILPYLETQKLSSQHLLQTAQGFVELFTTKKINPFTPDEYLERFINSQQTILLDHFERALISNSIECPAFKKNPNYQGAYVGIGATCGLVHRVMPNAVVGRPAGRECTIKRTQQQQQQNRNVGSSRRSR
jgi:hypothetical protein